jgi:hypothetical protein
MDLLVMFALEFDQGADNSSDRNGSAGGTPETEEIGAEQKFGLQSAGHGSASMTNPLALILQKAVAALDAVYSSPGVDLRLMLFSIFNRSGVPEMRLITMLLLLLLSSQVYAEKWLHVVRFASYDMFYDADSMQNTDKGKVVMVRFVWIGGAGSGMKTTNGDEPAVTLSRNLYTKDKQVQALERVHLDGQGKVLEKQDLKVLMVPIASGSPAEKLWKRLFSR